MRLRLTPVVLIAALLAGCAPHAQGPVAVPVGMGAVATDPQLLQTVAAAFAGLDRQSYRAVSVAQVGGTVLVVGAVVRPDQRRQVDQRLLAVPGVHQVIDRIVVTDEAALDTYGPDIRAEQRLAAQVPGNLAVRVVRGVVYAVGVASAAQIDQLKEIAVDQSGLQWVDVSAVTVR